MLTMEQVEFSLGFTPPQRMDTATWEKTLGSEPHGAVFQLQGTDGQGTFLVRVAQDQRIDDDVVFVLEVLGHAMGNA